MAIYDETNYTLTGAQIKDLAERMGAIGGKIKEGHGAPTETTSGEIGELYLDKDNGVAYICKEVIEESGEPDTYVWEEIGTGGGGAITLTQADADFQYAFNGITRTGIAVALLKPGSYIVDNAYLFFGYNTTVLMNGSSTAGKLYTYAPFSGTIQIYGAEGGEADIYSLYHPKRYALIETGDSEYCSLGYTLSNGTAKTYDMTNKSGFLMLLLGEVSYESIERFPLVYPPRYGAGLVIDFDPATFVLATDSAVANALGEARRVMRGATSLNNGLDGRVPQPLIADREKFLRGDGTWASSQSDYDENDNTASGYIQNRPFYDYSEETTTVIPAEAWPEWFTNSSYENIEGYFPGLSAMLGSYASENNLPTSGAVIYNLQDSSGTSIDTAFPGLAGIVNNGDTIKFILNNLAGAMSGDTYYLGNYELSQFEDYVDPNSGRTYKILKSSFNWGTSSSSLTESGTLVLIYHPYQTQSAPNSFIAWFSSSSLTAYLDPYEFYPHIEKVETVSETKLLDSKFLNIDGQTIINDDGVLKSVSSEGIKTLTTENYDYPASDPNGIALWNLEPGIYRLKSNSRLIAYFAKDNGGEQIKLPNYQDSPCDVLVLTSRTLYGNSFGTAKSNYFVVLGLNTGYNQNHSTLGSVPAAQVYWCDKDGNLTQDYDRNANGIFNQAVYDILYAPNDTFSQWTDGLVPAYTTSGHRYLTTTGWGDFPKSDYNENDSARETYIQNRPFYEETTYEETRLNESDNPSSGSPVNISGRSNMVLSNFSANVQSIFSDLGFTSSNYHAIIAYGVSSDTYNAVIAENSVFMKNLHGYAYDMTEMPPTTMYIDLRTSDINLTDESGIYYGEATVEASNDQYVTSHDLDCIVMFGQTSAIFSSGSSEYVWIIVEKSSDTVNFQSLFKLNYMTYDWDWYYIGKRTESTQTHKLDSKFINIDGQSIVNDSGVLKAVSDGGIKTLTTADYPSGSSSLDFATLECGYYKTGESISANNGNVGKTIPSDTLILKSRNSIFLQLPNFAWQQWTANNEPSTVINSSHIIDRLNSTSAGSPLSANQGKVLKDLIDSIAIRGAGAPTTSTVGTVGQLYEDGTNGALYQLKSIDITVTPNTYNWETVGGSAIATISNEDWEALI